MTVNLTPVLSTVANHACTICLEDIDELDSIQGCCRQIYHYRCFKGWLQYRQICTICKNPINSFVLKYLMITPNLEVTGTRISIPAPREVTFVRPTVRPRTSGRPIMNWATVSGRGAITGVFTNEQRTGCQVRGCSGFCLCHM